MTAPDGKPLPGLSLAECVAVPSGCRRASGEVDEGELGAAANNRARRFGSRMARLFAFWISQAASGASGGYVAAGGPVDGPRSIGHPMHDDDDKPLVPCPTPAARSRRLAALSVLRKHTSKEDRPGAQSRVAHHRRRCLRLRHLPLDRRLNFIRNQLAKVLELVKAAADVRPVPARRLPSSWSTR